MVCLSYTDDKVFVTWILMSDHLVSSPKLDISEPVTFPEILVESTS